MAETMDVPTRTATQNGRTGNVQTAASSQKTAKNMDSTSGEFGQSGISESHDLSPQDSGSKKLNGLHRPVIPQWQMNKVIRDSKLVIFPHGSSSILPIGTPEHSPVDQYYLNLEYFTDTTILNINAQNISNESFKRILHEMGLGIEYLHQKNILHRNIHSRSVLINPRSQIKIINLENASYGPLASGFYGCGYAPPEILVLQNFEMIPLFTFSDDLYALGVTIYILNYGDFPYSFQGHVYYPYQLPDKDLQSLIHSLLHDVERKHRMSDIENFLIHAYFKKTVSTTEKDHHEYVMPLSKEDADLIGSVTTASFQASEEDVEFDASNNRNEKMGKSKIVESIEISEKNNVEEKKKKKKPLFRCILSRLNPLKKRKQKKEKTQQEKQVSVPDDKTEQSASQFLDMNVFQMKFSDEFQEKSIIAKCTEDSIKLQARSSSEETIAKAGIQSRPKQALPSSSFATSSGDGPKLLNALKHIKMGPSACAKLPVIKEEDESTIMPAFKIRPPPPSKNTSVKMQRPIPEEEKEEKFIASWDAFGQDKNWAENAFEVAWNSAQKFESDFDPFHQENNWPESTCHKQDLFHASCPWGDITEQPSLENESDTFDNFFANQNSICTDNVQVNELNVADCSLTVETAERTAVQKSSETIQSAPIEDDNVEKFVQKVKENKKSKRRFGWMRKLICGFNKRHED